MMIHGVSRQSNIRFAAGKTKLVTDMGGTFMFFPEKVILNPQNTELDGAFNKFYSQFRVFCGKARDKFHLTITTSQTKQDFDSFLSKTIKKGLNFLLPDKLSTTDGTFLKVSPREFRQSETKIAQVKALAGWDKSQIFNDAKQVVNSVNPEIKVLELEGEKIPEGFFKNQKNNNYVILQKGDSNFEISLLLPQGIESKTLMKKIGENFKEKAINVEVKRRLNEKFKIPVFKEDEISELKNSQAILLQPKFDEDNPLTKLYDTRKQVLQNIAEKKDDFFIFAGDSINDASMLNPFNYFKKPKKAIDDSVYEKWLSDENVLKELKEMPFVSIIVGKDPWLDPIREIGKMLDKKNIHKIITIDNPQDEFLPTIKKAMHDYAQENPTYRKNLGEDLTKEVIEKDVFNHVI